MIDPKQEPLLTFSAAVQLPELSRNGQPPKTCTLWRWAMRGCRGVFLETIVIGGTRCTTRTAIARFIEELTTSRQGALANV